MAAKRVWLGRLLVPALLLVLAFLVLGDLSNSLGRIQVSDLPARSIDSTRSTFDVGKAVGQAREAWCLWNTYDSGPIQAEPTQTLLPAYGQDPNQEPNTAAPSGSKALTCVRAFGTGDQLPVSGSSATKWIVRAYTGIDLGFVLLYLVLSWYCFRRMCDKQADGWVGVVLGTSLVLGLLAAGAKDAGYWMLAWPGANASQVDAVGRVLAIAPVLQLIGLGVAGLVVLRLLLDEVRRRLPAGVSLRQLVSALRIQLVVVAVFVLIMAGIGQNQVADALLRLVDLDNRWWLGAAQIAATLVAMGCLALLTWLSAFRLEFKAAGKSRWRPPPLWVFLALAGVFAVAGWWLRNLWGLAAVLLAICVVAKLGNALPPLRPWMPSAGPTNPEALRNVALRAARWLAAAPIFAFGVAMVRAALPPWLALDTSDRPGGRLLTTWIVGLAMLGVGVGLVLFLGRRGGRPERSHRVYWVLAAFLAAVYVLVVLPPTRQAVPVILGPISLVAIFLSVVLVVGNEVQRQVELTSPLPGLQRIGATRNPMLLLVLVWLVLGRLFDTAGPYTIRTQQAATEREPMQLQQAFDAWAKQNCADDSSSREAVPMVFVAAEGGGIRAAYWTAGVLDTVFPLGATMTTGTCTVQRREQVFALSGASGGSVGIMFWLNAPNSAEPAYQRTAAEGSRRLWYDKALTADFLSPLVARLLYVDLPRYLFGYPFADRAAVLEESWESSQPALANGYLGSYDHPRDGSWRPIGLLNAAAVESGCRALVSPVELTALDSRGPGSLGCRRLPDSQSSSRPAGTQTDGPHYDATGLYDLAPLFLCPKQDIASSTAALLSARFPYVTPSGQLTQCGQESRTYIVDGGYLDNSGSMTATDMYQRVRPYIDAHNAEASKGAGRPIKPLFVQIDNGYPAVAQGVNPDRPYELLVPPRTRLAVAGALEPAARQWSYETFGAESYLRIANAPHPGVLAPTGWTLSGSSQYELCQELNQATDQLHKLAVATGSSDPLTSPACRPAQGDLLAQASPSH
ncbi:hypothetical protein [Flindersiella endophytica]